MILLPIFLMLFGLRRSLSYTPHLNSRYTKPWHTSMNRQSVSRYYNMQSEVLVKDRVSPQGTIHEIIPSSSYVKTKLNPINKLKSIITQPFRYFINKYRSAVSKLDNEVPMLKYLWPRNNLKLKIYLILSVVCLFVGKWFTLQVPFAFQRAIDVLASPSLSSVNSVHDIFNKLGLHSFAFTASIALISYGFSRGLAIALAELKTCLFTNVSQNVCRKFAMDIFERMHSLGKMK